MSVLVLNDRQRRRERDGDVAVLSRCVIDQVWFRSERGGSMDEKMDGVPMLVIALRVLAFSSALP